MNKQLLNASVIALVLGCTFVMTTMASGGVASKEERIASTEAMRDAYMLCGAIIATMTGSGPDPAFDVTRIVMIEDKLALVKKSSSRNVATLIGIEDLLDKAKGCASLSMVNPTVKLLESVKRDCQDLS